MKKWFIPALAAALVLSACSKTVNNWVYIYTEVTDFEELYAFIYNRASTFENVEKAADAFYDQVKDTVTAQYSLTLQKVLSTSAMKLADQTKEPIRKYSFNRE